MAQCVIMFRSTLFPTLRGATVSFPAMATRKPSRVKSQPDASNNFAVIRRKTNSDIAGRDRPATAEKAGTTYDDHVLRRRCGKRAHNMTPFRSLMPTLQHPVSRSCAWVAAQCRCWTTSTVVAAGGNATMTTKKKRDRIDFAFSFESFRRRLPS